jgi:MFS family permease
MVPYLFFQGVAALLWEPLSDSIGRRSTYIYTFGAYMASSIVLSFSPNLALLIIFRAVQAFAIASTVSIGNAIVQDICVPSDRSSFLNFCLGMRNLTIVIAPVLGGLLSTFLGFRSIFVFHWSLALAILVVVLLFLPETLRSIAGNGSVRLSGIHQPLIVKFGLVKDWEVLPNDTNLEPRTKLSLATFVEPLYLLKEKDTLVSLIFGGIVFAIWMMLTVSTPGLFRTSFKLNDLLIGVSFIPNAVGAIAGSTVMGNIMNRDFLYASSKYKAEHSLPPSKCIKTRDMPADFPLEHTRLRQLPIVLPVFVVTLSGYGFTLAYPEMTKRPGWILLPLFLQFIIAASANAICAMHQTMVSDLWYENGRAGTACATLVKCMIGAFGVGLIQVMVDGVGNWSAFVALGLVVMVLVPLPVALWYWGLDWRAEREARRNILSRVARV